jgi:hypothetical protein
MTLWREFLIDVAPFNSFFAISVCSRFEYLFLPLKHQVCKIFQDIMLLLFNISSLHSCLILLDLLTLGIKEHPAS